jgi:hypothetical protein
MNDDASHYLRIIGFPGNWPLSVNEFATTLMTPIHPSTADLFPSAAEQQKERQTIYRAYEAMIRAGSTNDANVIERARAAYNDAIAPQEARVIVQRERVRLAQVAMDAARALFDSAKTGDVNAIELAVLPPANSDAPVGLVLGAMVSQSGPAIRAALRRVHVPASIGDIRVITVAAILGDEILALVLAATDRAAVGANLGDVVRAVVRWASSLDAIRAVFERFSVDAPMIDECDSFLSSERNTICLAASREALGGPILDYLRQMGATNVAGSRRYSSAHSASYICALDALEALTAFPGHEVCFQQGKSDNAPFLAMFENRFSGVYRRGIGMSMPQEKIVAVLRWFAARPALAPRPNARNARIMIAESMDEGATDVIACLLDDIGSPFTLAECTNALKEMEYGDRNMFKTWIENRRSSDTSGAASTSKNKRKPPSPDPAPSTSRVDVNVDVDDDDSFDIEASLATPPVTFEVAESDTLCIGVLPGLHDEMLANAARNRFVAVAGQWLAAPLTTLEHSCMCGALFWNRAIVGDTRALLAGTLAGITHADLGRNFDHGYAVDVHQQQEALVPEEQQSEFSSLFDPMCVRMIASRSAWAQRVVPWFARALTESRDRGEFPFGVMAVADGGAVLLRLDSETPNLHQWSTAEGSTMAIAVIGREYFPEQEFALAQLEVAARVE